MAAWHDHRCPWCDATFTNIFCLGPHKRHCTKRPHWSLKGNNLQIPSSEMPTKYEDCTTPDSPSATTPDAEHCGLYELAQRDSNVGVQMMVQKPPVGMIAYFPEYTADYRALQSAWEQHTDRVCNLFESTFWDTFAIVREQPGKTCCMLHFVRLYIVPCLITVRFYYTQ